MKKKWLHWITKREVYKIENISRDEYNLIHDLMIEILSWEIFGASILLLMGFVCDYYYLILFGALLVNFVLDVREYTKALKSIKKEVVK